MSDKPRRRICVAAIAATLLLAPAASEASPAVLEAGDSGRTAAEVRRYWTPKRMENARPAKLLVHGAPVADEGDGTPTPRAGPIAYTSGELTDTLSFPNRVHGKVFFTRPGVGNFVCSGTAVESNNLSTVITAGHCVHYQGVWSTNFEFVPGYPNEDVDGNAIYGEWAATEELAPTQWVSSENFSYDVGAAVVAENGSDQALEEVVGARGILFNRPVSGAVRSHGYPALSPFDGSKLRYCDSNLGHRDPFSGSPQTMGIGCDMNGGSSGGGWVIDDGGVGSVISVNSYTTSTPEVMYGPFFGSTAQALYNSAQGEAPGGPATPAAGGLSALLQSLRTAAPAKKCKKKQKKRRGKKKRCRAYR